MVLFPLTLAALAQEPVTPTGRVASVVVFPDRAQVTRVLDVELVKGTNRIEFRDLPPTVEDKTLAAEGSGVANAQILGLDVIRRELAEDRRQRIVELEKRIAEIGDAIRVDQDAQKAAQVELEFLDSLRVAAAAQTSAELLFAEKTATHADAIAELLKVRVPDAQRRVREAEFAAREKSAQLAALQRELDTTRGASQWARRDVVVEIESPAVGHASVELQYVLPGASWTPAYDVRAHPDKKTLDLTLHALVTQTSGEDWSDASVSLSTARPAEGIHPPVLDPYWLQQYVPTYHPTEGYDPGAYGGATMDDAMKKEAEFSLAPREPEPPPPPPMALATATVTERAVATTFEVPGKTTIPGDGTQRKMRVAGLDMPAEYVHVVVPRLEESAFLVGNGTWKEAWPLLPGDVASFVDDSFVGSFQTKLVGSGGEFEFAFGTDDAVKVEREVKIDTTSLADWLGFITRELGYTYEITNRRTSDIQVEIRDRIPVSTQERFRIRYEGDLPDEQTTEGILTFKRLVAQSQTTSVAVTTIVRYPRRAPPGNLE